MCSRLSSSLRRLDAAGAGLQRIRVGRRVHAAVSASTPRAAAQQLARIRLAAASVPRVAAAGAPIRLRVKVSTHASAWQQQSSRSSSRRAYPLSLRLPHACAWVGGAAPAGRWQPIRAPARGRRPCRRARQSQPLDVHDRPQQPQSRPCARTTTRAPILFFRVGLWERAQEGQEHQLSVPPPPPMPP
jgi:hypothetical protein